MPSARRCSICGHRAEPAPCRQCRGTLRSLQLSAPVTPGRGLAILDLPAGLFEVHRAVFALVHGRPFVGLLPLPLAMNAVAFLALAAGLWFGLWPAFTDQAGAQPGRATLWIVASWLLLAPPLLELIAGPAQEPILAATERTMLDLDAGSQDTGGAVPAHRLGDRAKILLAAIVMLPLAMALVLVPWVGLPATLMLGSAMAAVVWFEPPLARRGYGLDERMRVLWRNRWRALGVGCGLQFAAVVPFVNVLLLPSIAAIATTSAFLRGEKQAAA